MHAGANLYHDLAYVFVAAVLGGLAARALRQPLILGYVVAGILIGPFTPGPTLADTHALEVLAEIGVILLMYSIGIEFHPRDLLEVKWVAIGGGALGIILSICLGLALAYGTGLAAASRFCHRGNRQRRQHHGLIALVDRSRRAALCPWQSHDRHHSLRGRRRRHPHRVDAQPELRLPATAFSTLANPSARLCFY